MVEAYSTCTHESSSYSNIFALTAGTGKISDSSFLSFASSIGLIPLKPGCQFPAYGAPHILTPVSLLTATSTSFGSFPRTAATSLATIKPTPPSGPDLLVASPTEFKPSAPSGPELLVASPTEFFKPPSNKPTQHDIPNNNEALQEKLPERTTTTTRTVIPAPSIVTTHDEGISRPKEEIQSSPNPNEPLLFTLPGNQIITAGPGNVASISSEYIIGDHTLTPGGSITVSGTPIYLAPSASEVIVGSQTVHPQQKHSPSSPPQPIFIGGGQTLTAQSDKLGYTYIVDDQTLIPGGTVTVSGTSIYLAPSASEVIIGSQTVHLQQPPSPSSPQPILIGGSQTLTAQSDKLAYIIDDQTLTPGGTIAVSGTSIYLAPSASELIIIGSQTIQLQAEAHRPPYDQHITIGGQPLTAQSDRSGYISNGQTIQPGSPAITIAGKYVSLEPSMSALIIIDGSSSSSSTIPLIVKPPFPTLAIIAGKTIAFAPKTTSGPEYEEYIIDGQTLRPGYPAITVSGIAISLAAAAPSSAASATALVIIGGTKTSPLVPLFTTPGTATTSTSSTSGHQPGLGDLILGGFNSATTATEQKNATQAFSGRATSVRSSSHYPERLIFFIIIIVNIGICIWV